MTRQTRLRFLALCATALLGGALGGCKDPVSDVPLAQRRIRVTTTVGMITDIVRNIGGDRVTVTGLMGPGIDPHYYRASAGDIDALKGADIIFYNGLELEGRMVDLFEKMDELSRPTFPVTRGIARDQLRQPPEFHGRYDPHVWFDVTLWKEAAKTVAEELAKLDPGSANLYRENAQAYLRQMDDLHVYVKNEAAKIPETQRVVITAHDAFGYFGRRYGFDVRGLQGISTASETGARDIQDLAAFIAERKIKAIFVESSVPRNTIEAVRQAVRSRGWNVVVGGELFSDAMGRAGTPEGTYIGMVRHNIDTIAKALK